MSTGNGRMAAGGRDTAFACLVAVLATLASVVAEPAGAAAKGRSYYVDCKAGRDSAPGTSAARPWKTLGKASAARLGPGDALLFKRSTHCRGVLEPKGSGTVKKPIVAGAYGNGSRPILDGAGARAAIVLHDVQGWTVRGLAITNPGPTTTVGLLRSAIQIENDTLGVAAGFTIEDNAITDVDTSRIAPPGESAINYSKVSGGIQLLAAAPNGFTDVRILRNTLTDVAREGISVRGGVPTKRLVIRGNTLKRLDGDGIVVVRGAKALVERNVVAGFNRMGTTSNAGMWAYHSTDVTFQFNEVSGGANGPLDGMAYDIDGGNVRTLFQYNLSHDNTGGFLMVCGDPGSSVSDSTVRYNISQNDSGQAEHAVIGAPPCGAEQNIKIYNNTVYTRDRTAAYMVRNTNRSTFHFTNNILVGPAPTTLVADGVSTFDANLYANVTCRVELKDAHAVVGDPGFVRAGRATSLATADGYRLRKGSPALGAGTVVPGNGGRDFFGNAVSKTAKPNIGAYQGPGVAPKAAGGGSAPGCGAGG